MLEAANLTTTKSCLKHWHSQDAFILNTCGPFYRDHLLSVQPLQYGAPQPAFVTCHMPEEARRTHAVLRFGVPADCANRGFPGIRRHCLRCGGNCQDPVLSLPGSFHSELGRAS